MNIDLRFGYRLYPDFSRVTCRCGQNFQWLTSQTSEEIIGLKEWLVTHTPHLDENKETVDHPAHYGGGDNVYEHIKVCDAWGLNYRLGNATKYIARAGKKTENPLEDLKKARWYLDSEIKRLEES